MKGIFVVLFTLCVFHLISGKRNRTVTKDGKNCTVILPGTNYEYLDCEALQYLQLGEACTPEGRRQTRQIQTGLCKATLYCNPKTKRCDCEDTGPYIYAAEGGKCRNIVGSSCFISENCVKNANCVNSKCVCKAGKKCLSQKTPA